MAKKTVQVQPINAQTWLLQPITLTMSKFNYNVPQTKALVLIVEQLQKSIKESLKEEVQNLKLFNTDGDSIFVDIAMKDLTNMPQHYDRVRQTLKQLASIPVEMMETMDKKKYTHISALCEAYIPNEKFVRHIKIKIKKSIAAYLVDARTFGYQRYVKEVVLSAKSKYTQRIYMMLSSFKQQGHMQITPDNLREKFNELGSSYQNSWKAFRKNVIDKAKEELLQLYKENRCELYFEYKLIYKRSGRQQGEPDVIEFSIFVSPQEKERMEQLKEVNYRSEVKNNLLLFFGLNAGEANKIISRLSEPEDFEDLLAYSRELLGICSNTRLKISDVKQYAFTALQRYVTNLLNKDSGVEDAEFVDVSSAPALPKRTTRKKASDDPGEAFFSRFVGETRRLFTVSEYEDYVSKIALRKFVVVDGVAEVSLKAPSKEVISVLETQHPKKLQTALKAAYDGPIKLLWYVKK